jgi:hypothetical protein
MKIVIYETGTVRAMPDKKNPPIAGIEYCAGWSDFANMGLAAIAINVIDTLLDTTVNLTFAPEHNRLTDDEIAAIQDLFDTADILVSFNGKQFDNKLLMHYGLIVQPEKVFDLFREVRKKTGKMFSLHNLASANEYVWIEQVASCPVLWQTGERQQAIESVEQDCDALTHLVKRILIQNYLDDRLSEHRYISFAGFGDGEYKPAV